jgi:hypothetical protein
MAIGPVQLLIFGFRGDYSPGEIRRELSRLRESDTIRLLDVLFVRKHLDGSLEIVPTDEPADFAGFGAMLGDLIAPEFEDEDGAADLRSGVPNDIWFADDGIPPGSAAAIALVEHRWAVPLLEAIERAGGVELGDAWINRADLAAVGLTSAAQAGRV